LTKTVARIVEMVLALTKPLAHLFAGEKESQFDDWGVLRAPQKEAARAISSTNSAE